MGQKSCVEFQITKDEEAISAPQDVCRAKTKEKSFVYLKQGQKPFSKRTKIFPDLNCLEFKNGNIIMQGVYISSGFFLLPTRCIKGDLQQQKIRCNLQFQNVWVPNIKFLLLDK